MSGPCHERSREARFRLDAVMVSVAVPLLLLAGCQEAAEADLLELQPVDAAHESGERLSLSGRGFPAGRAGALVLTGEFIAPGMGAREVQVRADVRALTGERAEATIDEDLIASLGGRGTFRGTACFEVAGQAGSRVTGCAPGRLDVAPRVPDALARARRHREAAQLAEELGLRWTEESAETGHPVLASVDVGGRAHAAGLRVGDRVVRAAGMALRSSDEVLVAPGLETLELEVERGGDPVSFSVPLVNPVPVEADTPLLPSAWLVLAAWLVLLVVGRPAMQGRAAARGEFPWLATVLAAVVAVALRSMSASGLRLDLRVVVGIWAAASAARLFDSRRRRDAAEVLALFTLPGLALVAAVLGGSTDLEAIRRGIAEQDATLGLLALNPLAAVMVFGAVLGVVGPGTSRHRLRLESVLGAALVGAVVAPSFGVNQGSLGLELLAVAVSAATVPWLGWRASFVQEGRRFALVGMGLVAGLALVFLAAQGRALVHFPILLALVFAAALGAWVRPGLAQRARVQPFL